MSRLMGHTSHSSPFRFKDSPGGDVASSTSVFAIVPKYPKLGGHRLAFFVSTAKDLPRALPNQYLGLLNTSNIGNFSNHLFAVELDIVQDSEFGNINDNHVGIDIKSRVSNASVLAAYYDGGDDSTKLDLNLKIVIYRTGFKHRRFGGGGLGGGEGLGGEVDLEVGPTGPLEEALAVGRYRRWGRWWFRR